MGCQTEDSAPKTSHFEHDHEVAAHWPSDLADAAIKMRERLVWIETGEIPEHDPHDEHDDEHDDEHHGHDHGHDDDEHHDDHHDADPQAEIVDLVSWVPEVAADTDLSEADWLPLYHASESLMANLRAAGDGLSDANQTQIESLCQLIDEAVPKIPGSLASLQDTSP